MARRFDLRWLDPLRQRCRPAALALALAVALPILGAGAFLTEARQATPSAAAACPSATPGAPTAAAGTPAATQCVTITMRDIYFDPNLVTLPADTPVTLVLVNQGVILHNFSVTDHGNPGLPNLNIVVDVQPGETKTVTFNAGAGTYYFFCNQPGHEAAGMRGYLDVKPGAAIATTEVTPAPTQRAG